MLHHRIDGFGFSSSKKRMSGGSKAHWVHWPLDEALGVQTIMGLNLVGLASENYALRK